MHQAHIQQEYLNPEIRLVVMGVSGAGKSEVGRLISKFTDTPFIEGDEFHDFLSKEKLSMGISLTDRDRAPWIDSICLHLKNLGGEHGSFILACSSLKRSYRERLRRAVPNLVFIHLHGSFELIGERLSLRTGHFSSAKILESQFNDLEHLQADEVGVTLSVENASAAIAMEAINFFIKDHFESLRVETTASNDE
jgi:gluconokinase